MVTEFENLNNQPSYKTKNDLLELIVLKLFKFKHVSHKKRPNSNFRQKLKVKRLTTQTKIKVLKSEPTI